VNCKLAAASRRTRISARLTRRSKVYASGRGRGSRVSMRRHRPLRPGRYRLVMTVIRGSGGVEVIRTTVRIG
jgi:hypothetical protein